MHKILKHFLNSVLLFTLSLMLVFPVIFSGLAINPKISPETGIVLGTADTSFGGNLKVLNLPEGGSMRKVEFTIFPGQETYYRDFMEVINESNRERRFRVKLLEVGENVVQEDIDLSFRRSRNEVVLAPGESAPLNLIVHGQSFQSLKPFKAAIIIRIYSQAI